MAEDDEKEEKKDKIEESWDEAIAGTEKESENMKKQSWDESLARVKKKKKKREE